MKFDARAFKLALDFVAGEGNDPKVVSAALPNILYSHNNLVVIDLFRHASEDFSRRNAWLPEALMLFNMHGLTRHDRKGMNIRLFPSTGFVLDSKPLNKKKSLSKKKLLSEKKSLSEKLADANARIGKYALSFSEWRYLAKRMSVDASTEEPSLFERYGMKLLTRDTDNKFGLLPNAAMSRFKAVTDQFGRGFFWSNEEWYVEYRRAYILCSRKAPEDCATVLIRNSSYHFGRDKLPSPAYVSWEQLNDQELQTLTEETLTDPRGRFSVWQKSLDVPHLLSQKDRIHRIDKVLTFLDKFEADFNIWLHPVSDIAPRRHPHTGSGMFSIRPSAFARVGNQYGLGKENGFKELLGYLMHTVRKHEESPRDMPYIYISTINGNLPPWFPRKPIAVTRRLVLELEEYGLKHDTRSADVGALTKSILEGGKIVLLTDRQGDFSIYMGDEPTTSQQLTRPSLRQVLPSGSGLKS